MNAIGSLLKKAPSPAVRTQHERSPKPLPDPRKEELSPPAPASSMPALACHASVCVPRLTAGLRYSSLDSVRLTIGRTAATTPPGRARTTRGRGHAARGERDRGAGRPRSCWSGCSSPSRAANRQEEPADRPRPPAARIRFSGGSAALLPRGARASRQRRGALRVVVSCGTEELSLEPPGRPRAGTRSRRCSSTSSGTGRLARSSARSSPPPGRASTRCAGASAYRPRPGRPKLPRPRGARSDRGRLGEARGQRGTGAPATTPSIARSRATRSRRSIRCSARCRPSGPSQLPLALETGRPAEPVSAPATRRPEAPARPARRTVVHRRAPQVSDAQPSRPLQSDVRT